MGKDVTQELLRTSYKYTGTFQIQAAGWTASYKNIYVFIADQEVFILPKIYYRTEE